MLSRAALLLVLAATCSRAQLSIREAVRIASEQHPDVQQAMEKAAAELAGIRLARTDYLPRVDFLGQVNRATHNNEFGLLEPQPLPVISSISGPVLGTNNNSSVWGSAVGALVSWEPFDFGLRKAKVGVAMATATRAHAAIAVTRLQIGAAAADTFLTIQAAREAADAARAGVERSRVLSTVIGALAQNQLRPGAEASRARAELAAQQTRSIQADQDVAIAKSASEAILGRPLAGELTAPFAARLPAESVEAGTAMTHPSLIVRSAAEEEVKAREMELGREYYPKFSFEGTRYARGTGVLANGQELGGAHGLGPNTQNWAVGMTVTFSLFDFAAIHAKQEIETHDERAAQAVYRETVQELNGEIAKAGFVLQGAQSVAANTPVQLQAAEDTERQATARYQAGLGTIADVADAERLLTQSQIDDRLARLAVWRAVLHVAVAQGDLAPFLDEVSR